MIGGQSGCFPPPLRLACSHVSGFPSATRPSVIKPNDPTRLTRRALVGGLAAAGVCRLATRPALAAALRKPPLGLQLFSVDEAMQRNPRGTLQAVAALGYQAVELVGYYGMEPAELRAALDAAALTCTSIHIRPHGPSGRLPGLAADPELHFRRCRELGVRYLVCPGPWFPESVASALPQAHLGLPDIVAAVDRMTAADWRASAELVNHCARQARAQGLQLLYHNGNLEFARSGTSTGYDTLLQHFDPDLVELELDCGWIMAAGRDPLPYLAAHAGRTPLIHIKDMLATAANHRMQLNPAQIGAGIVDWRTQLGAATAAGVERAFIEQEAPFARPPMDYARDNLRFLQTLR